MEESNSSTSSGSQSGRLQDSRQTPTDSDIRGKHRKMAEIKRLTQEIRFLEEELEELDKTDKSTSSCKEMVQTIENAPDPLLPVTKGPSNPIWDRWFEGPLESDACKCWIF